MWSKRPYTFDRVVRIVFTILVGLIVLRFLYVLRDVLLPFCVACLVAYIIEPWVEWNGRVLKLKNRTVIVLLTCFESLLILGIFCVVFVPIMEREFDQLALLLHKYIADGHPEMGSFPASVHRFMHEHFDMRKIILDIEQINSTGALEKIWQSITSGLDKILGVLGWLISFVYVIFILLDFDKYKRGFFKFLPNKYRSAVTSVMGDLSWSMKRYFRNQALISFITGLCYTAGFSIVGIPMAVVIGVMNMFLFMVPYLVYVSLIPVTVMCFFKSMETGVDFWTVWLECLAVYACVEIFSDLILTPKIMGKAMGLNPAVILLSLSVWGTLLGLLGMVIALPATTIIGKWVSLWLENWKRTEDSKTPAAPPDS